MAAIRLAEPRDSPACAAIYAPFVRDSAVSFELSPPDAQEIRDRIEGTLDRYPWLVCEHDGRVIGFAYASRHRQREAYQWDVESSVYVQEDYHRTGVGRALYESLFAVLREQGFYNVYAGTTLPNRSSEQLHRSMGFEPVGVYENVGYKMGQWRDVKWWHLAVQAHDDEPEPPTPIEELTDQVALEAILDGAGPELER